MDKCGICDKIKKVRDIWNIPIFQNRGLIIINDPLISQGFFPNNNICEDCVKQLLDIGRVNGKKGFGYRFQRQRVK
ncbi:hypothetical protein LCGC14_1998870 [marine sediment metagenome]|uniref:Uncharacterized protein n=1 Tax=marine sediment metagenome TaxID=412755 RepID=A0A0F9F421_9ZZZZ